MKQNVFVLLRFVLFCFFSFRGRHYTARSNPIASPLLSCVFTSPTNLPLPFHYSPLNPKQKLLLPISL